MCRIDDDAHGGNGKVMFGGDASHDVRFHVDHCGAGCLVKLSLLRRLSDRMVDAEDRCMDGAVDQAEQLSRPHCIRRPHGMRIADRGGDHPIAGAEIPCEPASDSETDHPAITVPNCAVGDRFQFAAGGAANDEDTRGGGDARLEVKTYKCDDKAAGTFNGYVADQSSVVGAIHQPIYESPAGKIQLGSH